MKEKTLDYYVNYGDDFTHEVRMNSRTLTEGEFAEAHLFVHDVMMRIYYIADEMGRVPLDLNLLSDSYRFGEDDVDNSLCELGELNLIEILHDENNNWFIQTIIPLENEFLVDRFMYRRVFDSIDTFKMLNTIHHIGEYNHEKQDGNRKEYIEAYQKYAWG